MDERLNCLLCWSHQRQRRGTKLYCSTPEGGGVGRWLPVCDECYEGENLGPEGKMGGMVEFALPPHVEVGIYLDDSPACPINDNGYGWEFVSFGRRHASYQDPDDYFPADVGLRRKLECGTAFLLSYFEHGLCSWDLAGEGYVCQWDTTSKAGLLIWTEKASEIGPDKEARTANARKILESYTSYCNGQVYGYQVKVDGIDDESCWGFYETDWLLEHIADVIPVPLYDVEWTGDSAWIGEDAPTAPVNG